MGLCRWGVREGRSSKRGTSADFGFSAGFSAGFAAGIHERGARAPGFGHPVHRPVAPRAERILELAHPH